MESFLPIGCMVHFYVFDEKIHQTAALFWVLRDVGILQLFYLRAVLQRTIVHSPTFLESGLGEKIVHTYNPSAEEVGARVLYVSLTSEKNEKWEQSPVKREQHRCLSNTLGCVYDTIKNYVAG